MAMKYDAQDSNVMKEAEEKKKGGRVKRKMGGRIAGSAPASHMGRAARKDGGRVGSDKSPLSSAHGASAVVGHKTDD